MVNLKVTSARLLVTILSVLALSFFNTVQAQNPKADSILQICKSSVHDSIKSKEIFFLRDIPYSSDSVAEIYFQKMDRISKAENSIHLKFAAKLVRSGYAHSSGALRKSLQLARDAKMISFEKQFPFNKINFYLVVAYALEDLGEFKEAKQNYLDAVRIARETNDSEFERIAFFGIAHMYSMQGMNDEALKIYKEQLKKKNQTATEKSGIYMMLGNVQWGLDKHKEAVASWKSSIRNCTDLTSRIVLIRKASCLHNLSYWYMEHNQVDSALIVCREAYDIRLEVNDVKGIISSHTRIGDIYTETKNHSLAEKEFLAALSYIKEDSDLRKLANLYLSLARNFAGKNDHVKAEEYYEKHIEAKNRFINESNIEEITTLKKDFEFESERKEQKAILLESEKQSEISAQRNQWLLIGGICALLFALWGLLAYLKIRKSKKEIADQKEKLEQSVKDKQLLLKEIHHRVKNNLQVVSGLLSIQYNRTEIEEVKVILEQSQGRIFSIAAIHELLYDNPNVKLVDATEYIDRLVEQNVRIHGDNCTFAIATNGISLTMDEAIPLGLMLNEMITNSYKHGFGTGEQGKIDIELKKADKEEFRYAFSFKENGKGFDQSKLDPKRKSLGLRLIDLMTQQMDGKLDLNTSNGMNYSLFF